MKTPMALALRWVLQLGAVAERAGLGSRDSSPSHLVPALEDGSRASAALPGLGFRSDRSIAGPIELRSSRSAATPRQGCSTHAEGAGSCWRRTCFASCRLTFELSRPRRRARLAERRRISQGAGRPRAAAVAGRRLERGVRPHQRRWRHEERPQEARRPAMTVSPRQPET